MSGPNKLNNQQREAVLHKDGPLLVLAGAGAGKTRVIIERIGELIRSGTNPREILAITFTNKAAKEMRERVYSLLEKNSSSGYHNFRDERPYVSTFHALGANILRENHNLIGLPKHFNIFDENDSLKAIKESIKEVGFDPKQIAPAKILSIISKMKGDGIKREEYSVDSDKGFTINVASMVWERYEATLKKESALDFGDLLFKTAEILKNNKEIKEHYQKRWRYVHIDEYQDTNRIQYEIATLITGERKNIFVVGDVDQNIYSWRGADIRNILNFEKDFKNPKIIMLEENYRSTKRILEASNVIISKNKNRYDKKLFTKNSEGDKISFFSAYDEREEAVFVASKAKEIIERGINPNEISVLYRANFQSRILEEIFLEMNIPYQVLGTRFFERREIKDVLSFIRASLNEESNADIKRIINVPPRGIGKVTLMKMFSGKENELTPKVRERVNEFKTLLKRVRECALNKKVSETIKFVIKESGIEKKLKNGSDDDLERLENIKELVTLGKKYDEFESEEGITKLLEEASLASEQDSLDQKTNESKDGVKLMTVHASKGLEFEYVFITGLEEGLFPHDVVDESEERDEEEERRLFYVALTRAKKRVFLSYAGERTIYGGRIVNLPSTFLTELDEEHLEETPFKEEDIIEIE